MAGYGCLRDEHPPAANHFTCKKLGNTDGAWNHFLLSMRFLCHHLKCCMPAIEFMRGMRIAMAARLGLEPRQAESESAVLPLHHRAVKNYSEAEQRGGGLRRVARGKWSRRWDSNPQPPVYKTGALPLSYAGESNRHDTSGDLANNPKFGGSPGTRTPNQLIKSQLLYH